LETIEYDKLRRFERWYWWYRAQRESVLEAVASLGVGRDSRVLDAGCGSGANVEAIGRRFGARCVGVDFSNEAARLWAGVEGFSACRASVNEIPFGDGSFDVVLSVDVICCAEVRVASAVSEMARVLKPGGGMVLAVPAYQWMLSRHDEAVHCVRRFDGVGVRRLMEGVGVRVERAAHLMPTFFPLIAAVRLARKRRVGHGVGAALRSDLRSDLTPLPRWLNGALYGVTRFERVVFGRRGAPFGSTILAVGRKGVG
jgi:SAM-dependent methyltransferase